MIRVLSIIFSFLFPLLLQAQFPFSIEWKDSVFDNGFEIICKEWKDSSGLYKFKECMRKDSSLFYTETQIKNKTFGNKNYYFPNGKISKVEYYYNGMLFNRYISYFENGNIEKIGAFGLPSTSSPNQVFDEEICIDDINNPGTYYCYEEKYNSPKKGLWKYYLINGMINFEGYYVNNKKHGKWKYYNPFTGCIQKEELFDEGNIIKSTIFPSMTEPCLNY